MNRINRLVRLASYLLIGAGVGFLALYYFMGSTANLALPLVFLVLGAAFLALARFFLEENRWAAYFYIPGMLLLAFGLVFLLNLITNDWNAWAYAWLLLVAGAGLGTALAGRELRWPRRIVLAGMGGTIGGITLFALFGAIAGGPFIQVAAPVLLAGAGLALYRLRAEKLLPGWRKNALAESDPPETSAGPVPAALPEPLSARELEVLRLIDQGLTNNQIAQKLTVAQSTVKTHINNIYGKLSVETRVQALNRARELKLL